VDTDKGVVRATGSPQAAASRLSELEEQAQFFRRNYKILCKAARVVGATGDQAEEAVSDAMKEVLRRWPELDDPLSYARRAVFTNFIKQKKRDGDRVLRTIAGGYVTPDGANDAGLLIWEDRQWVHQMLASLPPAQREVMACVVDGLEPHEIGELLGKTAVTVRKNLQLAREKLKRRLEEEQEYEGDNERRSRTSTERRTGEPQRRDP
jgi:RNA polymerase sigma factor (sigma-70 family)